MNHTDSYKPADHKQRAMSQVQDAHHTECNGQSHGQKEEDHPKGNPIEQVYDEQVHGEGKKT
jgi:hypothetical protein